MIELCVLFGIAYAILNHFKKKADRIANCMDKKIHDKREKQLVEYLRSIDIDEYLSEHDEEE